MNKNLSKVFGWMFIGLLITFLTGYVISTNAQMTSSVFSGSYLVFVIVELILVIVLSTRIQKMSPNAAKACFILYSFVTGVTFSSIFLRYEMNSIMFIFLITAIIFGIFALIGMTTNIDLSKIGTYLFMALIGIIICAIINIFLQNSMMYLIISIVCVVVFLGYTAYDVQKIIRLYDASDIPEDNLAIYGALQLYLDFINIFLSLLDIFGNGKKD